jgi:hypothetical protein
VEIKENESIVLIEPDQMDQFNKRLEALNKKAAAFGLTPIVVLERKEKLYERHFETIADGEKQISWLAPAPEHRTPEHPVRLIRLQLQYPIIKLGQWQVIGKIEAMDAGNLSFSVSQAPEDVASMARYAQAKWQYLQCEHCGANRFRRDVFVLRNADGRYKQVGSTCLQDFTGIDPGAALFLAQMSNVVRLVEGELNEWFGSGRGNCVNTLSFLAKVSFLVDNIGFVSMSKARDSGLTATCDDALDMRYVLRDAVTLARWDEQREAHWDKAKQIRAWAEQLNGQNSFEANVKTLLANDTMSLKPHHRAFVAAAVSTFNRQLVDQAAAATSRHVGRVGQKETFVVAVNRVIPIQTHFGLSHLVLMRDKDGNALKWKASAYPKELAELAEGAFVPIAGKVKEHDDYKGQAQTVLTHVKVLALAVQPGQASNEARLQELESLAA